MSRIIKFTDDTDRTGAASILTIGPTSHKQIGASVVTKDIGATPTVTAKIQGSMDGVTDWDDIAGATATITTNTTTNITPTLPNKWYKYYRLDLSAFTNITVDSASLWASGFAGAVDAQR